MSKSFTDSYRAVMIDMAKLVYGELTKNGFFTKKIRDWNNVAKYNLAKHLGLIKESVFK